MQEGEGQGANLIPSMSKDELKTQEERKMITLFGFGPAFGLPDPSPFVMKTEVQLKMAGLAYKWQRGSPQAAPKGKVPFIDDGGLVIGDSTFIRDHIERSHRVDLDAGLCSVERALAWAMERMLEDQVYFALVHARWLDDTNWAKGPIHFFDGAPEGVASAARERVRAMLHGQGLGRHSDAEIADLAARSLESLWVFLGDKPYLMGEKPCGADATMFAMLAGVMTPFFDTPLREAALRHANLAAYTARLMRRYYPDFERQAA
jgi:glutathione S-transferase